MRTFFSCSKQGLLSSCDAWAFIAVARLVAEHRLTGSVVVAHGLSCPEAGGIFPVQGSNQYPLHCKADS